MPTSWRHLNTETKAWRALRGKVPLGMSLTTVDFKSKLLVMSERLLVSEISG